MKKSRNVEDTAKSRIARKAGRIMQKGSSHIHILTEELRKEET